MERPESDNIRNHTTSLNSSTVLEVSESNNNNIEPVIRTLNLPKVHKQYEVLPLSDVIVLDSKALKASLQDLSIDIIEVDLINEENMSLEKSKF